MSVVTREDVSAIYSQFKLIHQIDLAADFERQKSGFPNGENYLPIINFCHLVAVQNLKKMISPIVNCSPTIERYISPMAALYTEAKSNWENKKKADPTIQRSWSEYKEKKRAWVIAGSDPESRPKKPNIVEQAEASTLEQMIKGFAFGGRTCNSFTIHTGDKEFCYKNNILCPIKH